MEDFLIAPPPIAAVVLAGGQARRMGGGDKGRTQVGRQSILARIVATVRPQVAALALSANGEAARFADLGLPVLADTVADSGPLAGLLAGLDWAAGAGFSWLLTVPGDTPFLPADLVIRLGHALRHGALAAIAGSGGRTHPVVGLWSTSLAEPLHRFMVEEGQRKVGHWAKDCGAVTMEWP
ncbi:MAG TPA: molybdenum cofactor guanylyltransferase MobA, partial [Patescibacteria group bacterium]|nr:molybdenum cofactor guanylyltransferase MobA [Patescibacteria group bacterium]